MVQSLGSSLCLVRLWYDSAPSAGDRVSGRKTWSGTPQHFHRSASRYGARQKETILNSYKISLLKYTHQPAIAFLLQSCRPHQQHQQGPEAVRGVHYNMDVFHIKQVPKYSCVHWAKSLTYSMIRVLSLGKLLGSWTHLYRTWHRAGGQVWAVSGCRCCGTLQICFRYNNIKSLRYFYYTKNITPL